MPKIYTSVAHVVRVTMCYYDVIIITGNGKNSIISTKLDIAPNGYNKILEYCCIDL